MYSDTVTLTAQADSSVFAETMVEMSWPAIQACAENNNIVLLPVGIIEAHGPHMDLSADILLAHVYCRFLRQVLATLSISALIAPPLYWGHAADTAKYAGTFSVRPETMKALLIDILASLDRWGFTNVFVINCHGDRTHIQMIEDAIMEANLRFTLHAIHLGSLDIPLENPPVFPPEREGRFEPDYHAGSIETAQMHTFFPSRVNVVEAKRLSPSDRFDPLAYCGDPASFELEEERLLAFYRADLDMDARKIQCVLSTLSAP